MPRQPGKQQVARRRENGAQHEHAHDTQLERQRAADEGAHQRHDDAVDFGHGGHLILGVAHVHVERIGHDAHHHIADAVDADQRQDQQRLLAIALEEIGEGLHQRALQPLGGVACGRQRHPHGLAREQHREHAHQHARGHHKVGRAPRRLLVKNTGRGARRAHWRHLGARGDPQHPRPGPDHGQAVTGLVGGSQRALVAHVGRLDAKCVQRNVLRGGCEGHRQRAPHHQRELGARVGHGHAHQRDHDQHLGQQQPAATAPHPAREQGDGEAVNQRCPAPLEAVGQAHPAQVADGGAVQPGLAKAKTQRAQHQQQRQTGGEAQRKHAQAGGLQVHAQCLAPGGPSRRRLGVGSGLAGGG
jgi:hypothetical protein